MESGARLVEVLSSDEYKEEHIAGAINIPLGKMDWFAHDLPIEGNHADAPRAGNLAQRDIPTYRPIEQVGDVRERVEQAGWAVCGGER